MKAIILAAGMGKRLKKLTKDNPKCMIKVNDNILIERVLKQIDSLKLDEIILVLGYKKQVLKDYIETLKLKTKILYLDNNVYDKTNNIYSLYIAKDIMLNNDILLLESDIIFDNEILNRLVNDKIKNLAVVDKYESWMDGTCVKLDEKRSIIEMILSKKIDFNDTKDLYKTVNIYKFSKEFNGLYVPFLEAYLSSKGTNEYYESVLETLIKMFPGFLKALIVKNEKWYEIDDKQDLEIAESVFSDQKNKLNKLQERYGGYWRYPKLIDFCYLVNPYFPNQKMIDELKMNFKILLREYPSGLKINNFLASKYFDVDEKYIIVGNGAAELIKNVMETLEGKIGFIRPTFEEYPNRYIGEEITFYPKKKGFKYDASEVMNFFDNKGIKTLVLINPDNPSGNYILKQDLFKILKWTLKNNIRIIIDESFVDFANYDDTTLLSDEILKKYENLTVIKSISKSYGVPGLRLGILATSNIKLLETLKSNISIWNINSFGEYYMQIFGKYQKRYEQSIAQIKLARKIFIQDLRAIDGIEIYESEANYILARVTSKYSSRELAEILLNKYNIFIKDLTQKDGINDNYIRIAIRDIQDNKYFVDVLKNIFC